MSGQPPSSGHLPASLVWPPKGGLASEQALYLRDIVKSGRARGEAKTGDGPFAASPVSRAARFARPNRRACSQPNGGLTIGSTSYMYAKHLCIGGHTSFFKPGRGPQEFNSKEICPHFDINVLIAVTVVVVKSPLCVLLNYCNWCSVNYVVK